MNALLGPMVPDPVGQLLGTGYDQFDSPLGIFGLAKVTGDTLEILVVVARNPGTGQFRRFIAAAQAAYATICVWDVMNPKLERALLRYGFAPEKAIMADGEVVDGLRWDALPICPPQQGAETGEA